MTLYVRAAAICLLATCAAAGQQAPPPDAPSASQEKSEQQIDKEQQIEKKEQSQRVFGIVPMFGVTSRQNALPLTTHQKFHLFLKSTVDPFAFVGVGIQAGIGQAIDEFPAYGQGAAGYGKRYGAALADVVSGDFFRNFAYPSLLKQDPRYFRSGAGKTTHRIAYALSRTLVCRNDNGRSGFNFSNVLGAITAGGVSNAYYPSDERGFGLTMSRAAIALGYSSGGGLLDEFWPDIQKKFFHKKP